MITTFAWFGYELPKKTCFDLIKHAGFDAVTLWWNNDFGDNNFRNKPALAREAGLFVENIHTPFEDINNLWLDNLDGSALLDFFLRLVDDCSEYDIPTMVLHLSGGDPPPFNEIGLNKIKRIVERAEQRGINVAFENLRRLGYLEYVLRHVNSPRAGFCYDSGHHNCRISNNDLLSRYSFRLMALHLHDNDGSDDQHRLPFDGTIDWPATMSKITQAGYTGAVALEAANMGYDDLPPEEFLHLAFKRAKRLESLI